MKKDYSPFNRFATKDKNGLLFSVPCVIRESDCTLYGNTFPKKCFDAQYASSFFGCSYWLYQYETGFIPWLQP